jgi:glycosyltransferase involved in cell wall biosynthesis
MAYLLPVRSISTIHDLMHKYEKRFPEVSGYRLREYHYTNVCKTSSAILVDSKIGKKQVIESYLINPEKIFVLPFIPPYFKIGNYNIKHNYSLPKKFFFYPAQFWQHKNHEIIIHTLARLINTFPDMVFVFSGAPKNHYKFIVKLIESYNLKHAIRILGFIPNEEIPYIYEHARALVMPTFFGPTNIPPIEAMSLGCPVAVSDIYGMHEQVGDAGLFFNPNSIDELIEVLIKLWTDDELCKILSEKGKEKMLLWNKVHFDNQLFQYIYNVLF